MANLPTLHYFDLFARAESLRILFIHSKTPYNDHRIGFQEWREQLKPTHFTEFDQLPRLDIDGLELVQSRSMLKYAGTKLGYAPSDPVLAYKVDSLIDLKEDFYMGVFLFVRNKDVEGVAKWYGDNANRFLGYIDARLGGNHNGEGWFVGETVTLADIEMFELIWDFFLRPGRAQFAHYLDGFPRLKAFFERVLASSIELKAYYESREDKWF